MGRSYFDSSYFNEITFDEGPVQVTRTAAVLIGVLPNILTSPTNHTLGSGWSNEINAYDGDAETFAVETIS